MNIANYVSLFRVAVLPAIIYFVSLETVSASLWAVLLISIAIMTDVLDGYLARKKGKVTAVGSFIDPFADKVLIVGLLFLFALRGEFWLLALGILIMRDIIVIIIRWYASQDDVELHLWLSGEFENYAQFIVVAALLINHFLVSDGLTGLADVFKMIIFWLTFAAIVIAIISMGQYAFLYAKGLRNRIKQGQLVESEEMIILANRRSRGYKDRYRRYLLKVFSRRRGALIHFLPNVKDMYKGIIQETNRYKHIIIAGGDGSFESALNYHPFQKKSLGFFPLGAGNAFYSYFFKGKRFEYLRSRFGFRETELDVLELEWDKGRIETTFLSIGVDAEVMRLTKNRTKHGFSDYVVASWRALFKARADFDLICQFNGKKHNFENCINLTFSKIPYYGFSLRSLLGVVKPNDGNVYGLAIINRHSSLFNKLLRLWALLLASLQIEKSPLLPLKGKSFIVESEVPIPIQAGGEFLGFTQRVKVNVLRKQKVLII